MNQLRWVCRQIVSGLFAAIILLPIWAGNSRAVERIATLYDFWSGVQDVAVVGDRALLAVPSHGLVLLDVSDPSEPTILNTTPLLSPSIQIELIDTLFYVAMTEFGARFRLTPDDELIQVDTFHVEPLGQIETMWWQEPYLIVRDASYGSFGPWPTADLYYTIYELEDGELVEITNYSWGFGDLIMEIQGIAFVPPYLYLSMNGEGTVRRNIETGEESYVDQPSGTNFTVVGDFLYAANWDEVGIYSLADPANPMLLEMVQGNMSFGTRRTGDLLYSGWELPGLYFGATDTLTVFDISNPALPVLVAEHPYVQRTFLTGENAFICGTNLTLYDSEVMSEWLLVSETNYADQVRAVAASGDYAYLRLKNSGAPIVNLNDPVNPLITNAVIPSSIDVDSWDILGDYLFVRRLTPPHLDIYDLDSPLEPTSLGSYAPVEVASALDLPLHLYDSYYAVHAQHTLMIFDLTDPSAPVEVARHEEMRMAAMTNRRGLQTTSEGLKAWNFNSWQEPELTSIWRDTTYGWAYHVSLYGRYAMVLCGKSYHSPDWEFEWTEFSLLSLDYSDWSQPEIRWVRELGTNPRWFFGPRYGRYQLLYDLTDNYHPRFRVYDAAGNGPRGLWMEVDGSIFDAVVTYPYLLMAEGRQLSIYDLAGEMPVGVQEDPSTVALPSHITLAPSYPNPFNSGTMVRFALPRGMETRVSVFDLLGRRVRLLQDGSMQAGEQRLFWDGRSDSGSFVASGVYLLRLETAEQQVVQRVTLIK